MIIDHKFVNSVYELRLSSRVQIRYSYTLFFVTGAESADDSRSRFLAHDLSSRLACFSAFSAMLENISDSVFGPLRFFFAAIHDGYVLSMNSSVLKVEEGW